MNKITILLLFISSFLSSQTTFKKGYFKTSSKEKREVFFQAFGEKLPENINYYVTQQSKIEKISKNKLQEIFIENQIKYIRKKVSFEPLNPNMKSKINDKTKFFLEDKIVLLKVILESDEITLYSYSDENKNKYFFIGNKDVKLLQYKDLKKNGKNQKIKNYRNFLYKNYNSSKVENKKISKIKYKESQIKNYLIEYLKSKNQSYTVYSSFNRKFKDVFNISAKVGYSFFNTDLKNEISSFNSSYSSSHLNFGAEFEYFFNSYKKNISIAISFFSLSNANNTQAYSFAQANSNNSTINNKFSGFFSELIFRKYFSLNKNNYIFTQAGLVLNSISGQSDYIFNSTNGKFVEVEHDGANTNFFIGLGYNFKNFALQANYYPSINGDLKSNNTLATSGKWNFEKSAFNITLAYNLL